LKEELEEKKEDIEDIKQPEKQKDASEEQENIKKLL